MPSPADTIGASERPHELTIRAAGADDADACGQIFFDAFESIAARHNHPVEPSSPDFTRFKVREMLVSEGFEGFVAERDSQVLGFAFLDLRSSILGIGPVAVDPAAQDRAVGRSLMEAAMRSARGRRAAGVRLVQTAYHYRSLALYLKLGFVAREPLSVMAGSPPRDSFPGLGVRPAAEQDLPACGEICARIHGHDRNAELADAIAAGTACVVERPGGVCGYATGFGYGWHAVGRANEDLMALISAAGSFMGLGILVPSRNAELMRWCLQRGLRIVQQSNLMTIGLYNEPAGAYLPSIIF